MRGNANGIFRGLSIDTARETDDFLHGPKAHARISAHLEFGQHVYEFTLAPDNISLVIIEGSRCIAPVEQCGA